MYHELRNVIALAALSVGSASAIAADDPTAYEFRNGKWLDGNEFVARTAYVHMGRLQDARPGRIDAVVDLGGGHVVPPFCEAHNHNLTSDHELDEHLTAYLEDGVFYAKMLSNLPRETARVWHRFNRPDSVDVQFANGGITGPGGHPIKLRETLLSYGAYEGFTRKTLADHAYFVIDSTADLEQKWPTILMFRPDFLKLFLLDSEHHEERVGDGEYFGKTGLDPRIFPLIVRKAHEHGLRVSVHVESAADFRLAVESGVDEIAHMPGHDQFETLTSEDARTAAQKGIVVFTTASLLDRLRERDAVRYEEVREQLKKNLLLLHTSGVKLAIGSDEYDETSAYEANFLKGLGIFQNVDILRMWTENCATTVFPGRHIGRLSNGYEASFIVLDGNPVEDWSATQRIRYRFKDGRPLLLE